MFSEEKKISTESAILRISSMSGTADFTISSAWARAVICAIFSRSAASSAVFSMRSSFAEARRTSSLSHFSSAGRP